MEEELKKILKETPEKYLFPKLRKFIVDYGSERFLAGSRFFERFKEQHKKQHANK